MDLVKEYFKEHIDWKFYNYLVDKGTEFEDKGCNIIIHIYVEKIKPSILMSKHDSDKFYLICAAGKHYPIAYWKQFEEIRKAYEKKDFTYQICFRIMDEEIGTHRKLVMEDDYKKQYLEKVKHKCINTEPISEQSLKIKKKK